MNDSQIETLLRQAPSPVPPAGLKSRLIAEIRLPAGKPDKAAATAAPPVIEAAVNGFWKRWSPMALSFGALLMGCFVLVAWQAGQWWTLEKELEASRAARPDLAGMRSTLEELQQRSTAAGRTAMAAAEQAELVKLRGEVSVLTARGRDLAAARAENVRLRAAIAAGRAGRPEGAGADAESGLVPDAQAQARAKRIHCVNNMKQLGLALRMWANDHHDVFPMDFQSASNEMVTPKILTCTADESRQRANTWEEFGPANLTYEYLNPGGDEADPQLVLTRCPVHNNVGLSDGSVQQLGPNHRVESVNGKWKIKRDPQP